MSELARQHGGEGGVPGVFPLEAELEEAVEVFDDGGGGVVEQGDVEASFDARFHFRGVARVGEFAVAVAGVEPFVPDEDCGFFGGGVEEGVPSRGVLGCYALAVVLVGAVAVSIAERGREVREAGRGGVFVDELVDEEVRGPAFEDVLGEAGEVALDRAEADDRLGTAA